MAKNIFNIKSNYNFLESLSCWILEQYQDPLYLSKITLLLPSRRACREIKKIFLQKSQNQALILPKILAIGDVDYDELGPNFIHDYNSDNFENLSLYPLSKLKYNLLLISEIKKWNQKTLLFGKHVSSHQIARIASNLQVFLQEVEKEQLNLDDLQDVGDDDLAGHRQQILKFLRHFGSNWQNILTQNNLTSMSKYQNQMIEFSSRYLQNNGTNYPIIAAGSTGSVTATAHLLKAISEQKNGYIILYGLDKNISADDFKIIKESHPQFMLKKLIDFLEMPREKISDLQYPQYKQSDDQALKLISSALLPCESTGKWPDIKNIDGSAISHFTKIETKNNFDEAQIIALIIRKSLEEKDKTIALITNDRATALMVKMNLQKWQIAIDDSRYNHLNNSAIGNYLLAVAELFTGEFQAINLLAILKHKISRAGLEEAFYLENLRLFEIKILRDNFRGKGFEYLQNKVWQFQNADLTGWFENICAKFLPLSKLFTHENNSLEALLTASIKCAEELSSDNFGNINLYNLEGAEEFLEFSKELLVEAENYNIESASFSKLLNHFMSEYNFATKENFHPRLHILSTIEARLMNYDLTIISGLNEGEFPRENQAENWLGRKMRRDFGLPDSGRVIGISAYDFSNYFCNKEVIITRSFNKNNAGVLKSRFLMKLEAVLMALNLADKINDGVYYQKLFSSLSLYKKSHHIERPKPRPKLEHRPQIISVTDIKKWLIDPYQIYAKRVLNLKALDLVGKESSFAEFGNFVHKALENFIKNYAQIKPEERLDKLLNEYGNEAFLQYFPDPENKLLWWPKFENIAAWFIENEKIIRAEIKKSSTELQGKIVLCGVTITTKIDRIDINVNDEVNIIDYKTGAVPVNKNVEKGLEPQLPMEAVILCFGEVSDNFELLTKIEVSKIKNLQYYKLKGQNDNAVLDLNEVEKLITEAKLGIIKLITIFNDENMPYVASPNSDLYQERINDYHHLSRIEEWQ